MNTALPRPTHWQAVKVCTTVTRQGRDHLRSRRRRQKKFNPTPPQLFHTSNLRGQRTRLRHTKKPTLKSHLIHTIALPLTLHSLQPAPHRKAQSHFRHHHLNPLPNTTLPTKLQVSLVVDYMRAFCHTHEEKKYTCKHFPLINMSSYFVIVQER